VRCPRLREGVALACLCGVGLSLFALRCWLVSCRVCPSRHGLLTTLSSCAYGGGARAEESTLLFCCACELCQKVLQRLQAAWQVEWAGIEHLAGLPGGNSTHLEREWECLNYWCECEAAETSNEDAIRANLQDLAKDRDQAIVEQRTDMANRFEDAYWDLDWHL